jgi:CD109 antigen
MKRQLSRRKFIRIAGTLAGAGGISTMLAACAEDGQPTTTGQNGTATPSGNPNVTTTAVAVPTGSPQVMPFFYGRPAQQGMDGYLILAPAVLRPGITERVPVTLFNKNEPGSETVKVQLTKGGKVFAEASAPIQGRGELKLKLPADLPEDKYNLEFSTPKFQEQASVSVEPAVITFVETDKPIYKPGQTVQARLMTLDATLKPIEGQKLVVEVTEAKGNKVFKKNLTTDEYGMAKFEMPLSSEPNLGGWKITATLDKRKTELPFKVEKYVLPKFGVTITPASEWFTTSDRIKGKIKAEYTFGKPVEGSLEIKAYKMEGNWREFANIQKDIAGETEFELPAPGYLYAYQRYDPATGQPMTSSSNIRIDVTVKEKNTDYEEKGTRSLTALNSPYILKITPENSVFKPGLPFNLLVAAQNPSAKGVESEVQLNIQYTLNDFGTLNETKTVTLKNGADIVELRPSAKVIKIMVSGMITRVDGKYYSVGQSYNGYQNVTSIQSAYSPSGIYLNVRQVGNAPFKVGDTLKFDVAGTLPQSNGIYWEAFGTSGKPVLSGQTTTSEITFQAPAELAAQSRLLVYQILSDGEIVADYLPFSLDAALVHKVTATFEQKSVEPGKPVKVEVKTDGPAKVGLAIIDRAVYLLGENRLNLAQIMGELAKLDKKPAATPAPNNYNPYNVRTIGSKEVLQNVGVVALTNKKTPAGQQLNYSPPMNTGSGQPVFGVGAGATTAASATTAAASATFAPGQGVAAGAPAPSSARESSNDNAQAGGDAGLAQVERVRQFFPETWLWDNLATDANGTLTKNLTTPDSITTWTLNAVALSPKAGLGITTTELQVIQPFFVTVDTVYSAIRGEEFPVKVALYNYTAQSERFTVDLEGADWFDGLDDARQTTIVKSNDVAGLTFRIRPKGLGTRQLKITARSASRADAIIKDLLIEPEGVAREIVENIVLTAGQPRTLDMTVPNVVVPGSARAFVSVTGNFMTQSIEGLESLLKMPYGCGEQNMINCAPNVYVSRYLKETGQTKPELQTKMQNFLMTGYQRQLTYQRNDGSFSAFGNSDRIGSLWLTAFVLKTFAEARDLIYIDEVVLQRAARWIGDQQKPDGKFSPVGFVHHKGLMGGQNGDLALTAYVTTALLEFGDKSRAGRAVSYLESQIGATNDIYSLAQITYALELAKSGRATDAGQKLMALAKNDQTGIFWTNETLRPVTTNTSGTSLPPPSPRYNSASIETSGYGLLALSARGDKANAGQIARWLVGQRNAYGGWNSTQDTVIGLAALARFVGSNRADVDGTMALQASGWQKDARVNAENSDVLQQFDAPLANMTIEFKGSGQAVVQTIRRYNEPKTSPNAAFKLNVTYSATELALSKPLIVKAEIEYTPPEKIAAGMVVLEMALPTGFSADGSTINSLSQQPKVKRIDISGRRVQIYIEDMNPGEKLQYEIRANAQFPVKAQAVTSQVYAYYRTEWAAESLGGAITVK